ncbi:MAG: DNA polymerase IV [Candidatus Krumholzibacteriia bacterium]
MLHRAIIHVDMDAFYASVEVLDDPSLRGLPVIVGGTPEGRGVVAAASYEARRHGVHSAMSAAKAVRLCPHGVFRRPRMQRYLEVSGEIFAIFARYTPLVEPLSIDEAFLDVTGCRRLFGPPEALGRVIKECIRAEVGLAASVGIAPNKFLAKVASDLEKPDGLVVIGPGEGAQKLAPLPLRRLWGVGPATARSLHELGLHTIGDLQRCPVELLKARLGDHAEHLHRLARGEDDRPVVPAHEARSIGNEITFAEDLHEEEALLDVLDHLAEKVGRRLRQHGLTARTVTLKARFPDFTTLTRSVTRSEPTDASVVIRAEARDLLLHRLGRAGRPLRLLGVTASQLAPAGAGQAELFPDPQLIRQRRLDAVLDAAHHRFGSKLRRGAGHGDPEADHDTSHPVGDD